MRKKKKKDERKRKEKRGEVRSEGTHTGMEGDKSLRDKGNEILRLIMIGTKR